MLDFIVGMLGWGGMVMAPVAVGVLVMNVTGQARAAIMAAVATFALFAGWNAHSVFSEAQEAGELRSAIRERDRLQIELSALSERVEEDRNTIRAEVDDAITEIIRASADAAADGRGDCVITDRERIGLRNAFGTEDEATAPTGRNSAGKLR